jgi:hypothetical protein
VVATQSSPSSRTPPPRLHDPLGVLP